MNCKIINLYLKFKKNSNFYQRPRQRCRQATSSKLQLSAQSLSYTEAPKVHVFCTKIANLLKKPVRFGNNFPF